MKSIFSTSDCLTKNEIITYLNGQLSNDQRHRIEHHLLDCPLCSTAIEGYEQITDSHQLSIEQISEYQWQPTEPKVRKLPIFKKSYLIAATVTLLLIASVGINLWKTSKPEQLFSHYHQFYEPETMLRSTENLTETTTSFQQAVNFYNSKDYDSAIQALDRVLVQNPEDIEATLLLGMAHLENNDPAQAVPYLKTIRLNSDLYYDEATWYLALTYLKAGQTEATKAILEELSQTQDQYYVQKAEELKNKL